MLNTGIVDDIPTFADVVPVSLARELEARIKAAETLADAVRAFQEESWRDELASEMASALAAFRATEGGSNE